jgi:hypothetical protein
MDVTYEKNKKAMHLPVVDMHVFPSRRVCRERQGGMIFANE